MAEPAQKGQQQEHGPVRGRWRQPDEGHEDSAGERADHELPEQAGGGGIDRTHEAREHLVEGIEQHAGERCQGCRLEHAEARPQHDQDAEEAHAHGRPAARPDPLAQDRHGKGGDDQGRQRQERVHVGQRHPPERPDDEPDLDRQQQGRARPAAARPARAQMAPDAARRQDGQQQGDGAGIAQEEIPRSSAAAQGNCAISAHLASTAHTTAVMTIFPASGGTCTIQASVFSMFQRMSAAVRTVL
ncbi:MAG: hypothetical protein U1E17_18385 [Geminicoccaceae bacterium]